MSKYEIGLASVKKGSRLPRVYLAGKMDRAHDWRGNATSLSRYERLGVGNGDWESDPLVAWVQNSRQTEMSGVPFICVGPFPASCDHGCAHAETSLHMAETCSEMHQRNIVSASAGAIQEADIVCAHISTADAYGTLVELGLAAGLKKPCSVTIDHALAVSLERADKFPDASKGRVLGRHDLWFVQEVARLTGGEAHTLRSARCKEEAFENARKVHSEFIARHSPRRTK